VIYTHHPFISYGTLDDLWAFSVTMNIDVVISKWQG